MVEQATEVMLRTTLPLSLLLLLRHLLPLHAAFFDYPSANLSTAWLNSPSAPHSVSYPDGSAVTVALLRQLYPYGPSFAFGFHCTRPCTGHLLAIYILYTNSGGRITLPTTGIPQLVWSANRGRPVRENSTLELTAAGDLVLKEANGTLVWSTGTAGKSAANLILTSHGNLVLIGTNGAALWQSFDHPTDALLSGQKLSQGQKLVVNASATNSTGGQLYAAHSAGIGGFGAFVSSNPPQLYHQFVENDANNIASRGDPCFLSVTSESLTFVGNSSSAAAVDVNLTLANPPPSATQFLRLESDGHMKLYEWLNDGWKPTADVIKPYLGDCAFPTVCGSYGVCHSSQCRCPQAENSTAAYFKQVNSTLANLGCSPVTPLSCESPQQHRFLRLGDVSYFNYIDDAVLARNWTTEESCREACLRNCSCKAALFQYGSNSSDGRCYLPHEIFSLMDNVREDSHYNSTAYIKVQASPAPPAASAPASDNNSPVAAIVGGSIAAVVGLVAILAIAVVVYRRKRSKEEEEEDEFPQLPGMPARFSYEDLRIATEDFARKLGGGGFGSVFDGTLTDGSRVAVKKLESVRQGKREFLAEVETIGSIHHLNLVRLVGFCAERSYRLLVYDHMSNGSLDRWIFGRGKGGGLPWEVRRKIIHDVAKGLLYLHAECRQKIAHLDIKPQNILLDSNFDAKVSDFGLAKLIDRDQSAVMTMMRGTPGYLAPEWLTSIITEKVDVYSFGVVVAEIVCGRKNLDYSQPEESLHLLSLLKDKAEAGRLLDVVDGDLAGELETEKMLKLAIWCLQNDTSRRPSMSMVVKALEGAMEIDEDVDYDFTTPVQQRLENKYVNSSGSTPLLASELSGPR